MGFPRKLGCGMTPVIAHTKNPRSKALGKALQPSNPVVQWKKNGSTAWSGLGADLRLAALREDNVVGLEVPMDNLCDGEKKIAYHIIICLESLNTTPPTT